jgi:hypothetical protein
MVDYTQALSTAFTTDELAEVVPYSLVVFGTAGALIYSIRASLLNKYSVSHVVGAVKRHWFEVTWLILIMNAAAILLTKLLTSSTSSGSSKAVAGFFVGALCGSGASFVERNLWNSKLVSTFVLRPTNELSLAVLTRLDRAAGAIERADNDAWQCQSGYWNLGVAPGIARNRMRLIFEGSKERLVTRWGRSDIYFMDARWHPGNYFFLLVRFYGRKKLQRMLLKPPLFSGLRKDWMGEATRKVAGKPTDRQNGYKKGDNIRRYDHLG